MNSNAIVGLTNVNHFCMVTNGHQWYDQWYHRITNNETANDYYDMIG